MKQITDKERIDYLKMALAIAEVQASEHACDLIIRVYQKIEEKGGDVDLWDLSKIRATMQEKYKLKS
jgi:hypothetical protein